MSKKRDSFIVYRSFYEAIYSLENIEDRDKLVKAIFDFSLDQKETKLSGISATIWSLIKPQLLANNKKFINGCKPKVNYKNKHSNNTKKTEQKQVEQPVNNDTVIIDGEEFKEVVL